MPLGPWLAAAGMVTLGWTAGYPVWAQGDPQGFFRVPFTLWDPLVIIVLGAPLSAAAGWLLPSSRIKGYVILALTVFVLAFASSFSFFGGICLDPEDTCVTTWPTRVSALAAALLALSVGGLVARRRASQQRETLAAR